MLNIENTYITYDELVKEETKEVIEERLKQLYTEMSSFIKENGLQDIVFIQEMALNHAVMDYFSDIQRLKDYQKIEHINEVKIKAYETYWLLKRKPLQLKAQLEEDKWLYVNEKFLMARLAAFMLRDDINVPLVKEREKAFKNYLNTLYFISNLEKQTRRR